MHVKRIWMTKKSEEMAERVCKKSCKSQRNHHKEQYVLHIPANLEELKQRITTALQTVTQDMLQRVWEELEYQIDVCRVSGGAHIEHV